MWRITTLVFVGVVGWGLVSCSITCPDGKQCPDISTCCMTKHGYACCQYPKAVCCSDLAHCCPSGFHCNLVTMMCERKHQPWLSVPMLEKVAAEEQGTPVLPISPLQGIESIGVEDKAEEKKSSVVHCDSYTVCPDGTTCCRHPKGAWFCCPYSPGRCCLDGYHCCPYGYDCDLTYTHCVRQGLQYPFTPRHTPATVLASPISASEDKATLKETPMAILTEPSVGAPETRVIRCSDKFYCPAANRCCKAPTDKWGCCPYPLGQCCLDGVHCCEYGYTCDPSSMSCRKWYSQIPSGLKEDAKED
ncbi:progranulin-like [Polymixia lowei]